MHSSLEITHVSATEVLALRADIAEIWPEASRDRLHDILPRHAAREGFQFRGAFDESGRLIGFVYGYRGEPGQWWHDRVAAALGEEGAARWLEPCGWKTAVTRRSGKALRTALRVARISAGWCA